MKTLIGLIALLLIAPAHAKEPDLWQVRIDTVACESANDVQRLHKMAQYDYKTMKALYLRLMAQNLCEVLNEGDVVIRDFAKGPFACVRAFDVQKCWYLLAEEIEPYHPDHAAVFNWLQPPAKKSPIVARAFGPATHASAAGHARINMTPTKVTPTSIDRVA